MMKLFLLSVFILFPFAAKADLARTPYQYQCLSDVRTIKISALPSVDFSDGGINYKTFAGKTLSSRQNIFFASELTEFIEEDGAQHNGFDCCHVSKKQPLKFECDIEGVDVTTLISAVPYNAYPARRCGAAQPYLNVSVITQGKKIVDHVAIPSTDCGAYDDRISDVGVNIYRIDSGADFLSEARVNITFPQYGQHDFKADKPVTQNDVDMILAQRKTAK